MRRSALVPLVLAALAAAPHAAALEAGEARTRAFERLNDGARAYQRGEFLKAEEILLEAYNIHLNNFRAAYYLGLARIGARKYREALDPLERALEYRGRDLAARVALGEAYLALGDLAAARTELYRALEVREDYSPAFDGLARLAEASGKFDRARELFLKAITADMGNPDPHMNLGIMALRQDRLEEALRELEKAVTLRPDYARALSMLSRVRRRLGQHNDALAAVRRAMEIEPGNPAHAESLGRIYLSLGDNSRSEEAFHAALKLDPDHAEASDGLALALRAQGKFAEAADTLEWAARRERLPTEMAEEFRERARIYRYEEGKLARLKEKLLVPASRPVTVGAEGREGVGDEPGDAATRAAATPGKPDVAATGEAATGRLAGEAAMADAGAPEGDADATADEADGTADDGADGTAEVAPPAPTAADYAELARLSASVEDWTLAALAADEAVALAPDDPSLARQRAYYLLRAGSILTARRAYEDLEAGGEAEPEDLLNLGVAHARLGHDEEAIEAYRRARDTGLAPPEADLFLGLALERSGRRDEARVALERYIRRAGDRGDDAARVRRYLEMIRPSAAPSREEVFGNEDESDDEDDAGDEDREKLAAGEEDAS